MSGSGHRAPVFPMTPMVFMGEEWAASSPFQFFTDHDPELGEDLSRGRRDEFKRFKAFSDPAILERVPDPQSEETSIAPSCAGTSVTPSRMPAC